MNTSPRLQQIKHRHQFPCLDADCVTDVTVVGAGIAGMMTAYYTLRHTHHRVTMLEATQISRGATGHNAGQVVAQFERPLADMISQYGTDQTRDAVEDIESARTLLEEILDYTKIDVPYYSFPDYSGCMTHEGLLEFLHASYSMKILGLTPFPVLVSQSYTAIGTIAPVLRELITIVPASQIQTLMETQQTDFIALSVRKKGCINSALLCEQLINRMRYHYPDRLSIYEYSPISLVRLEHQHAIVSVTTQSGQAPRQITTNHVVLCTNGFEGFTIVNNTGEDIDHSFHEMVRGVVGYMSGYLDTPGQTPTATVYHIPELVQNTGPRHDTEEMEPPYYYLTRRPFDVDQGRHSLICVGGPERSLPIQEVYDRDRMQYDEVHGQIDSFLHQYFAPAPSTIHYQYRRHGLMGYTRSGLRVIGPDPHNTALMYNIGCNGVGILTSVFGGHKIAQLLAGQQFNPSVFDPQ